MAHALHTTHALVLGSVETKEADKALWLFTEDLGLVVARATSVREEVSKLRYALAELSRTRVTLVRGKAGWKVTGAEGFMHNPLSLEDMKIFGRISALACRVVPTEEDYTEVYSLLCDAHAHIGDATKKSAFEALTVARMLFQLGYLSCSSEYKGIIDSADFSNELLEKVELIEEQLIEDVNGGLAQSQL